MKSRIYNILLLSKPIPGNCLRSTFHIRIPIFHKTYEIALQRFCMMNGDRDIELLSVDCQCEGIERIQKIKGVDPRRDREAVVVRSVIKRAGEIESVAVYKGV